MLNPHWIPVSRGNLGDTTDAQIFAKWSPRFIKIITTNNTIPYLEDMPANALVIVRNHPMSEMGNRNMAINSLSEPLDQHYVRWESYQAAENVNNAALRTFNDPIIAADYHVSMVRDMLNYAAKHDFDTRRLLFEGLNEPQLWAGEPPEWIAVYYKQFLLGCHILGTHAVVGNFGVGWPGNGGVQDAPVQWDFFKQVTDVMVQGDYLGLHEYWALNGPLENWKWWAGRYQQCPYNVPILITECGIDTGVVGSWYGGWQNLPIENESEKAKRYLNELYWYANTCAVDRRVKGIFPFSYDGGVEWGRFNIRNEEWLNQFWPMLQKFKTLELTTPLPVLTLDQVIRIEAERHDVLPVNETAALAQEGFKRGLWPTSDEFTVVNPSTGKNYTCQRFRKMGTKEVHVLYCVIGNWSRIYSNMYIN